MSGLHGALLGLASTFVHQSLNGLFLYLFTRESGLIISPVLACLSPQSSRIIERDGAKHHQIFRSASRVLNISNLRNGPRNLKSHPLQIRRPQRAAVLSMSWVPIGA